MRPDGPIRVLIIDDGPLWTRTLAAALERGGDLHAVGTPAGLSEVRQRLLQYHPEVIVMDLGLRRSNPLQLLTKLGVYYPVPVIVMADANRNGPVRAVEAIRQGALEAVCRPTDIRPASVQAFADDLAAKIRVAVTQARPVPRAPVSGVTTPSFRAAGLNPGQYLVAVGASTGGTKALETLLNRVPGDFPPMVIVQHMPAGFTRSFASRLNADSAMSVADARDGELLTVGRALIARGDTHLIVRAAGPRWCVRYTHQEPVNRHCPSVDVLFDSVAGVVGPRAVGVLLTGMGADGAAGLLKMRQAGALTIAQSKDSCVVYGMPKVAVDLGAVLHTAAPEDIPSVVCRELRERTAAAAVGARRGT